MQINPIMRAENPQSISSERLQNKSPTDPEISELGEPLLLAISQTVEHLTPPHRDLWVYTVDCFTKRTIWTLHNTVVDGWTGWLLTSAVWRFLWLDQDHVFVCVCVCVCVFTLTVSTDFIMLAAVISHGFSCQQASYNYRLVLVMQTNPYYTLTNVS